MANKDLVIPVYLNQRAVFDLVAMLRGGISTVTKVAEDSRETATNTGQLGASFGLNKAFATLLRIDLSAQKEIQAEEGTSRSTSEERVHTPASLFFTLRTILLEKEILRQDQKALVPEPGDFVEFSAMLKKNSLIETLDSLVAIQELATIWAEPEGKSSKGSKQRKNVANDQPYHEKFKALSAALKAGGTYDLTTTPLLCGYRAVITLEEQYLNDPAMADLVDGTFRVIGKITRSVPTDNDSINLLRKTPLGRFPKGSMEQLMTAFQNLSETMPSFPRPEAEVSGPAIQVLPLAIFA